MNTFEKNIISIYREEGKAWLSNLQKRVQQIVALWGLDQLEPFDDLSHNYVLKGYQKQKPIVLKLGLDALALKREAKALEAFAGLGAIALLDHKNDALLLQRAVPGNSLKTHFPKGSQNAIKIACDIAKKIHLASLSNETHFPHIAEWLTILDKDWDIPKNHLQKARMLKKQLLQTNAAPVLLHGDLHQDNILSHDGNWVVIDPKGVIGYPINEVWTLVEDPKVDLKLISQYLDLNFDSVVKWYYVHLVLAACWRVEDNLDPKFFLDLALLTQSMMSL